MGDGIDAIIESVWGPSPDTRHPISDCGGIDAIIESIWGEDRAGDSRGRLSRMGRRSGRSHDVLAPIRLVDAPSPRSELPLAGSDRCSGEVLAPGPETDKDEPNLALTSLVVAVLAAEWGHGLRAKETDTRPVVELESQGRFHVPGRARLVPSRLTPPESRRQRSARAELLEHVR